MLHNRLVKWCGPVVFIRGGEMVLMELQSHPNSWRNYRVQNVDVGKNPFIFRAVDSKVPFEQGMQSMKKPVNSERKNVENKWCNSVRSSYEWRDSCAAAPSDRRPQRLIAKASVTNFADSLRSNSCGTKKTSTSHSVGPPQNYEKTYRIQITLFETVVDPRKHRPVKVVSGYAVAASVEVDVNL